MIASADVFEEQVVLLKGAALRDEVDVVDNVAVGGDEIEVAVEIEVEETGAESDVGEGGGTQAGP